MGLRPLIIFHFFQCEDRLYTSESDVCRRQILTYKVCTRAEKVKDQSPLTVMYYTILDSIHLIEKMCLLLVLIDCDNVLVS